MTEPGVPKLSFDPDEVIGEPADETAARFVASGFGPVLQIAHEDLGRPAPWSSCPPGSASASGTAWSPPWNWVNCAARAHVVSFPADRDALLCMAVAPAESRSPIMRKTAVQGNH